MDDQVTLTAYSDEIRALIRNDRNDEAIAIGKHILRYYPKYVEVYVHLGQAFLEKGRHDDAKELFRRVLSADPENIVAYAGLAILLEQEQLIAEAVWHMERAYELSPGNLELHQELHRLYHELDGRPRARLKLTPGALARLHIQEGLFTQAIQELNAIVAADGKRFDAYVALAQALWQAGQMRPAAEAAQTILKTLPYCLKANLILGAVWKEIGLAESEQYLQRAQELDPTNRVANQIFGARSPLPLAEPRVPRYRESVSVVTPAEPVVAEPIEETLSLVETPTAPPTPTETGLPPWLATPSQEVEIPRPPVATEAPTEFIQPEAQPESVGESPDWLARLRELESAPSEVEEGKVESVLPPWLAEATREEQPVSSPTPAETPPTWLEQLETPTEEAPIPARAEELPPWLAQPTPAVETSRVETPERAEELPPWLAQPTPTVETPRAEAPHVEETPERAEELPPWLAQPTPTVETPRAEAPHVEETPERAEELPPWLAQPTPTVETPRAEAPRIEIPEHREELPPQPTPTVEAEKVRPAAPRAPARKGKPSVRGESHLLLARAYRDANQIAEALREYDYIVQKAPRLVKEVIADLEVLAKRPGVPLEVHRILGDAYTRADRLADALAEYRWVLERVSSS